MAVPEEAVDRLLWVSEAVRSGGGCRILYLSCPSSGVDEPVGLVCGDDVERLERVLGELRRVLVRRPLGSPWRLGDLVRLGEVELG